MIRRLLGMIRPGPPPEPETREVILVLVTGNAVIVRAYASDAGCGWIARWIELDDAWSILDADGTATGCSLVKLWYPHRGWGKGAGECQS